jgi:SagB-type dehydrogenase family enzyme
MARSLDFLRNDAWELLDGFVSDQEKGVPPPPLQKVPPESVPDVELPAHDGLGVMQLREAVERRRSRRKYSSAPLSAAELSFLLWATQGIQKVFREGMAAFRTVPSGGARHPFETVLVVRNVSGVGPGLYRYMPLQHGLSLEGPAPSREDVSSACAGQDFVASAPVVFFWTAVPARTEWRYGPAAAKLIALDAGHLCQNLYLAAEALGLGTCAIGAYIQDIADRVAGVDGKSEAVVYIAPVGR